MLSELDALKLEKKERVFSEKFEGNFQFSETNNKGIFLPKHKKAVQSFAFSLDEQQLAQFFSILESVQGNLEELTKEHGVDKSNAAVGEFNEEMEDKVDEYIQKTMKEKKVGYNEAYKMAMKKFGIKASTASKKRAVK